MFLVVVSRIDLISGEVEKGLALCNVSNFLPPPLLLAAPGSL